METFSGVSAVIVHYPGREVFGELAEYGVSAVQFFCAELYKTLAAFAVSSTVF